MARLLVRPASGTILYHVDAWWLASYLALWTLVIVLALVVVALARQVGTLHLRLGPRGALEVDDEGPPLGEAPEPRDARDARGHAVTVGGPGRGQLILFISPGCPVCREVLPGVDAAAHAGGLAPIVVSDGGPEEGPQGNGAPPPVVDPELSRAFGVPGTPYAVVLDDLGVVQAKGTVNNLEQMEGLVRTAARRREAGRGVSS
jgi:methylamine dehydrogenase accessory protein MauD